MSTEKPSQFEYLLNAMDLAAAAEKPAERQYGAKRRAVLNYASALKWLADGYADLCTAYRLGGDHRRADRALARIEQAKATLDRIEAEHERRCAEESQRETAVGRETHFRNW